MKNRLIVCVFAILGAISVASAALAQDAVSPEVKSVAEANASFAADLHSALKSVEGNLCFSPYGISSALAMMYAGAHGDTQDQMAQALHFKLEKESLNAGFADLGADLEEIARKEGVQLVAASSIWHQKGYAPLKEYLDTIRLNYGATVAPVDFQSEGKATRLQINKWAEDNTHGKIANLIAPDYLERTTRLVLVNVLYFKGNWASQFKKELTKNEPFAGASGPVPMMTQENSFGYADYDSLQALELPFNGDDLSMVVLLPKKVDGLAELESNLSAANLAKWTGKLGKTRVSFSLPRFKIAFEFDAGAQLRAMGMTDAFDADKADFSEMTGKKGVFVTRVLHEAIVEVNEEGATAAAATAVNLAASTVPVFRADHPFLFLIKANKSGNILFMGRVVDPAK